MKTKFTKGEWKSRGIEKGSNGFVNIDFEDGFIAVYGNLFPTTEPENSEIRERAEANAKLIAASPDLYYALAELWEHTKLNNSDAMDGKFHPESLYGKVVTALNKTTL